MMDRNFEYRMCHDTRMTSIAELEAALWLSPFEGRSPTLGFFSLWVPLDL
jgi:hypothetical protein